MSTEYKVALPPEPAGPVWTRNGGTELVKWVRSGNGVGWVRDDVRSTYPLTWVTLISRAGEDGVYLVNPEVSSVARMQELAPGPWITSRDQVFDGDTHHMFSVCPAFTTCDEDTEIARFIVESVNARFASAQVSE